ncbi:MAG: transglycosylase SLT domain-containing protein [Caldilineaceae bacterium]
MVIVLALSACGEDDSPTPTPTATPESVTSTTAQEKVSSAAAVPPTDAIPTVTPIPPPTATAVPTLSPLEQLDDGQYQLRYGDYAAARKEFQDFIASPNNDQELRLQAQFDLARAYRADGMWQQALDTLATFTFTVASDTPFINRLAPRVWLLRSELQQSLADYAGSIQSLQQLAILLPAAQEMVQSEMASAYAGADNSVEAAKAYQLAAGASSDESAKAHWLELAAQIEVDAGRYTNAVAIYDTILTFAKVPDYRAEILYRSAQAYATASDETKAIERWQAITKESPESQSAYLALIELVNRNENFDLYDRGIIDYHAQAWYPAINAFQSYLNSVPITETRYALALQGLGESQLGAEDFDSAILAFDRVITEFATCPCVGQVWMDKALAQTRRGQSGEGRRTYRTFARQFPNDPLAPEALWKSGVQALQEDNEIEAAADFLALADTFPQSPRVPFALYAVATGAYRGGFFAQATSIYQRLQQDYPDKMWDAVAYWLGRSLDAHGQPDQAKTAWQGLVTRAPDIYYGVLSAMAMKQTSHTGGQFLKAMPTVAGPPSRLEGDNGSQAFAEQWLQQWPLLNVPQPGVLSPTIAADIDLIQGEILLNVDRRYQGLSYLNRVFDRYKDNPQALYSLSLEFERLGAYQLSIVAMQRFVQMSPAHLVEDAPIFLQKRIYPQPFAELIIKEAQANKIDPLLYFSLIRQESLFEEGARSGAAAQGLAQIMPATAREVAEKMGHANWSDELIYRPYINLRFGAYYLDWTRSYLNGNLVSALVGYNAGVGNAEQWRETSGEDDMLFVEVLTLNEPRIYVQAVTSNLYHYTRLYGSH